MDSEIFEQYVLKLDMEFHRQDKKFFFIIDKCPPYAHNKNLKALGLVFLLPNTTSKTQPMDQRVMQALKSYYFALVVKRLLNFSDAGKEVIKVSIFGAMCMLVKNQDAVSLGTIISCLRKTGISKQSQTATVEDMDDPFKLLVENLKEQKSLGVAEENLE